MGLHKNNEPLAEFIAQEERIRDVYEGLLMNSAQENIRFFLETFMKSHEEIIGQLTAFGVKPQNKVPQPGQSQKNIHATYHLMAEQNPDLNSLQSTLLFIAKSEQESLDATISHSKKIENAKTKEFIVKIIEAKKLMASKADRLYHDFIESKLS